MQSGDHRAISPAPLRPEQFVSAVSQASVSLTSEKVTTSPGLSQAACTSPFSAGPGLTLVLGPLPEAPIIKSEQPGCRARRHQFSNLSARKGLRLLRLLSPGPPKPGWVFTSPGEQDKLSPSFLNLSVSQGRGPGSSVLVVVLSESDSYFLYSV